MSKLNKHQIQVGGELPVTYFNTYPINDCHAKLLILYKYRC